VPIDCVLDPLYEIFLMENKNGPQSDVLENIKKKIAAAEEERRELRFIYTLNDFEQGNVQVLKNNEFYKGLESYLLKNSPENIDNRLQLVLRICEGVLVEEIQVRERASALLSSVTEFHLNKHDKAIMLVLVRGLCNWLEFETEMLPGFSVLNKRLEDVLIWLLNNSYWQETEEVVILLHRIRAGSLKKSKAIKSLTNKTLQTLESNIILERLTDEYLQGNEQQRLFQNILFCIGHKAAIYLLNRVIISHSRTERLDLVNLVSSFGKGAVPALEDCLGSNPPWTAVRDVIHIISKIGNDANYDLIEQYFGYADERLQHEMIRCVLELGGKMMKPRLIKGLGYVRDRLKIHILHLLVEHEDHDENVFKVLLDLADKRSTFSVQSDHDLMFALIAAFKKFPCKESVEQLVKMWSDCSSGPGTEQIALYIDDALKYIEPKIRHNLQNIGDFQNLVSFDTDPVQQRRAFEKVRKTEEQIQVLVRAGEIQRAGQLIYDQAIASAKMKDFSVAELLRDRLLEINPMALEEVIQLGEFIEEQKNTSITSHHLEIWQELYEEMTTEEFNELYYALRQENYHKGDVIVQSGETDNHLYFLNSGYISLSCIVGGKEIFLKRMQPSNVLGADQFFSPSVWTVTLKALGETQVHVLDHAELVRISENYPGIEEKLRKYCQKYAQVPELLKMSGEDRREYPRYSVDLPTRNVLLDPYGNKGKRIFNGQLFDISKQGIAFTIKISSTSNARLLLGRHIMTTVIIGDEELPQLNGVIVGVRLHESIMQDFSVHVKLTKTFDEITFKKISSVAGINQ
jgi:hypothetical protein